MVALAESVNTMRRGINKHGWKGACVLETTEEEKTNRETLTYYAELSLLPSTFFFLFFKLWNEKMNSSRHVVGDSGEQRELAARVIWHLKRARLTAQSKRELREERIVGGGGGEACDVLRFFWPPLLSRQHRHPQFEEKFARTTKHFVFSSFLKTSQNSVTFSLFCAAISYYRVTAASLLPITLVMCCALFALPPLSEGPSLETKK